MCIVGAAYALYEIGSGIYGAYNAISTALDPNASTSKKAMTIGLAAVGLVAPGGGYSALDDLADAAKALDKGGQLTKAGRAREKHGSRPGSAFAAATGNVAAKKAAGQAIVEDILTAPGGRIVRVTSGKWKGGNEVYAPDGRGVRYNAAGKFEGFLEPPR